MSALKQIMLMIETSNGYGRGLIDGVARYAMMHGEWSLYVKERGFNDDSSRLLRSWKGDGIIFRSASQTSVGTIRRKGVPAVDTNAGVIGHGFPLVYPDEDQIAKLAVAHFLERRFQNFGFCAVENLRWVRWRRQAYLRELARLGHEAHVLVLGKSAEESWHQQHRRLAEWASALPKPVAILAANDVHATRLIAACRTAEIRIPKDVAILGVDHDEVLCWSTSPPLSSVDLDPPSVGYRAASLLDELLAGVAAPAEPIWIHPRGVVARQSTNHMVLDDADVVQAMSFIRSHACQGIDVADVLRNICVSRATLERKFAACLQTTPGQVISQLKTQQVKCFLTETSYAIEQIAQLAGYRTQSNLSVAFKRETGLTPGEYRRQFRGQ